MKEYIRKNLFETLWEALNGELNLIQVVTGPRQVGKTTLALQTIHMWQGPTLYETADQPNTPSSEWITTQWEKARSLTEKDGKEPLLALDEIQKIPGWSTVVKKLFDEDKRRNIRLRVIILGSSALLVQRGLTESLAGRFEMHRHSHWSYKECHEYFSLCLEEYLYFGGYPGALPLRNNEERWGKYIRDSLIETVLSKDLLLMTPVSKPALLRQVFGLSVSYPAQIISYQKMLGQLQEAGNASTVANYITLLSNAFLLSGLEKYSGSTIKQRSSSPKLILSDNALISAMTANSFNDTKNNASFWGRLVENAIGAHLSRMLSEKGASLLYWRERQLEVDFVFSVGQKLYAIEVKTAKEKEAVRPLLTFKQKYKNALLFVISPKESHDTDENGICFVSIEKFLLSLDTIL